MSLHRQSTVSHLLCFSRTPPFSCSCLYRYDDFYGVAHVYLYDDGESEEFGCWEIFFEPLATVRVWDICHVELLLGKAVAGGKIFDAPIMTLKD